MSCRFLFALALLACHHPEPSPIEQRFDALTRVEHAHNLPERAQDAAIAAAYAELSRAAGARARISNHDLMLLFDGAYLEAFYMHDAATVHDAAAFLSALQARGIATNEHYRHMFDTFVGARMFTEARALAERHPMNELLPELRESKLAPGQPTELAVDSNARVLLHKSVDLHPIRVIVVSHPQCHFSQNAMRDIQTDPALREAFLGHAKWLAPPHNNLEFDAIQRWNREHPEMEHTIAYRMEEWPMIDSWGTPTFYFVENGVVRTKVEGWTDRTGLLAAMRQVGMR